MFPLGVLSRKPTLNSVVKLLMHFDNNWTDESPYNRTFTTANGTPNFVTNSKFGSHSYKMSDGYDVYHNIKCSHDDGFDAITLKKEWQIDFWLNLLDDGFSDTWILRKNRYDNNQTSLGSSLAWSVAVSNNIDTRLDFRYMHSGGASQNIVSSLSNALNTQNVWHHCRIVSNGTHIRVFVNGVGGTAAAIAGTGIVPSVYDFFIGVRAGQFGGGQYHTAIDELQIKSGFDTFDPSLTLALLHFDGANNSTVFTDNSPFNQTVAVVTGTPKISTAMSRFGGSSLYLDGSSSIKIPNNANLNLGTGAFTIEFWFYLLSLPSSDAWFLHKSGSPQQAISISHSTRQLFSGFLSASLVSAATITAGAWHHVAVVRESANGQIKQYFNGLNEGTMNNSGSVDNAGDLTIGSWFSGSDAITGYIDEFRIRKEAMYLANFTPPTQPFTY